MPLDKTSLFINPFYYLVSSILETEFLNSIIPSLRLFNICEILLGPNNTKIKKIISIISQDPNIT